MPAATLTKPATPVSTVSSMGPNNNSTTTAIQSGPYTKAQFQSTMEGSRTIKNVKEVEQLLRDYPAGLELYRTGKYKVKVKCEADFERVILVEKRKIKDITNDNQQNNQTVPDASNNEEKDQQDENKQDSRRSRSHTHSQDRVAPTTSITNAGNIVHTAMTSIRMTSNTQPKVDNHRPPSKEREASVTPQLKQQVHRRSQSRDSHYQGVHNKYGTKINYENPKMLVPYVPNTSGPNHLWQQQQQQRVLQPYFSNPSIQQQQQQQQQPNIYRPSPFVPQKNPIYQQPYFYGQRPVLPPVYQQQSAYQTPLTGAMANKSLHSMHNGSLSSQGVFNTNARVGLPPSFRTFHAHQQQVRPSYPTQQLQVPFPRNHPWLTMPNGVTNNVMNNNNVYGEQRRDAIYKARNVDTGLRTNQSVRSSNFQQQQQQQPPATVAEHYHHHHHHRHQTYPTNAPANQTGPSAANGKEPNDLSKEPNGVVSNEKLTIRQLKETFNQADPSGRLSYSSLPAVLQRFGIILTENDLTSAAQDLEYNINEPISARRIVHVLVKLGKITKSTRQPVSPSMLPEDREVTHIMKQRQAASTHIQS